MGENIFLQANNCISHMTTEQASVDHQYYRSGPTSIRPADSCQRPNGPAPTPSPILPGPTSLLSRGRRSRQLKRHCVRKRAQPQVLPGLSSINGLTCRMFPWRETARLSIRVELG
ncbi:hypothetical protein BS78_06G147300 [Paspalum vaginatum]|nr:hypothetical protein BS78_06G147300 [Paspalum vaginatum]